MGWGRTLLLGDIGNRLDIEDCERDIANLRARAGHQPDVDANQDARLWVLERENAELKLYLATMVRMLIAKGVITKDEFSRFVDIIDTEDGATDGEYTGSVEG